MKKLICFFMNHVWKRRIEDPGCGCTHYWYVCERCEKLEIVSLFRRGSCVACQEH
jgi:hypothetical protein